MSEYRIRIRPYAASDEGEWDRLVNISHNGTFLHTRRFLAYHGDRFEDASLVIEDANGRLLGVFPAALDPAEPAQAVSHPGITYGGIVHAGGIRGGQMLKSLEQICCLYKQRGLQGLTYKAVPHIYHRIPAQDDLYALFRLGARRYRSDLAAALDLEHRAELTKGRRWALKKATSSGLEVTIGPRYLAGFWEVLEENLWTRHSAKPVHTLEEIERLSVMFPDAVVCIVGTLDNIVVAGVVLFVTPATAHTQYVGASDLGRANCAIDLVLAECLSRAQDWGVRYFDFGTSNEHYGTVLNEGLYDFKTSFGAGGVVHEFYSLSFAGQQAL
jgi:hypothetical protein